MPKQTPKVHYLAGPMSGIKKFNFPAFDEAAESLRKRGWYIVSPAELDDETTRKVALASKTGDPHAKSQQHTWGDFLSRDVKIVADQCQGIVFLPGWHLSRGARLEAYVGLLCKHEFHLYLGDGRTEKLRAYDDVFCKIFAYTETDYDESIS